MIWFLRFWKRERKKEYISRLCFCMRDSILIMAFFRKLLPVVPKAIHPIPICIPPPPLICKVKWSSSLHIIASALIEIGQPRSSKAPCICLLPSKQKKEKRLSKGNLLLTPSSSTQETATVCAHCCVGKQMRKWQHYIHHKSSCILTTTICTSVSNTR